MKRNRWMFAVAVAFLLGVAPMLSAQVTLPISATTSVTGTVAVEIPFRFSLEGKTFRSGTYVISPLTDRTISLHESKGKDRQNLVVMTYPVVAVNNVSGPKLIFHRYGDDYFLTQAWLRQSDSGREFPVSPDEIRMARQYKQDQVILVAKSK